jgi:GDP-4-dehydro-6-deoxy-alpha-D-mannose 3-dehydratase
MRIANAKFFAEIFLDHPYIDIQKEIGESSWFGFALILKENSPLTRIELVNVLTANQIDCRPIVTGNFLKNVEVLEHFDYEVSGIIEVSEYIDKNGFFVGNQQLDITENIQYLFDVINDAFHKKTKLIDR